MPSAWRQAGDRRHEGVLRLRPTKIYYARVLLDGGVSISHAVRAFNAGWLKKYRVLDADGAIT